MSGSWRGMSSACMPAGTGRPCCPFQAATRRMGRRLAKYSNRNLAHTLMPYIVPTYRPSAGARYAVGVIPDDSATPGPWEHRPLVGTRHIHPRVCCLCSSARDLDGETLWRTHTTRTGVESVFRSLKSEPDPKPSFHQTRARSEGRLFVSVVVRQLAQTICRQIAGQGDTGTGSVFGTSPKGSSISPRPSGGRSVTPCMCARLPAPNNHRRQSIGLLVPTWLPGVSGRWPSVDAWNHKGPKCFAIRICFA